MLLPWSSPHTRGCFSDLEQDHKMQEVFPAYAGVFHHYATLAELQTGLPRIRGGVSIGTEFYEHESGSSPHTRGCFYGRPAPPWFLSVFPAYAGVFPMADEKTEHLIGLPRIRGGVSASLTSAMRALGSSPHTRGCFCLRR